MENKIEHYYDIEPVINLDGFVELMFAVLASKAPSFSADNIQKKTAILPIYYKELIENVMYSVDDWKIAYSKLIDIRKYYNSQLDWELEFGKALNKYILKHNKSYRYDFEYDEIEVELTENEIQSTLENFEDTEIETMTDLISLFSIPIYTRKYKLEKREMDTFSNRYLSGLRELERKNISRIMYKSFFK